MYYIYRNDTGEFLGYNINIRTGEIKNDPKLIWSEESYSPLVFDTMKDASMAVDIIAELSLIPRGSIDFVTQTEMHKKGKLLSKSPEELND